MVVFASGCVCGRRDSRRIRIGDGCLRRHGDPKINSAGGIGHSTGSTHGWALWCRVVSVEGRRIGDRGKNALGTLRALSVIGGGVGGVSIGKFTLGSWCRSV